jgi:hypothetical protein
MLWQADGGEDGADDGWVGDHGEDALVATAAIAATEEEAVGSEASLAASPASSNCRRPG